jgi:MFS family permease
MSAGAITRSIWVLSLVSLFTDMASDMLYPVMPAYLRSIGFSVAFIGLLEGIAEAAAGLSKGYFGYWSDMSGKRLPFVRLGYTLSALSKPLMAAMAYPLWIFLVRTLDRLGKGIRTGARDAILADASTHENRGKVFGFHRSMDTVGAALGPALALIWLYFRPEDYIPLFFIAFLPGIISVLLLFTLKEQNNLAPQGKTITFGDSMRWLKTAMPAYRTLLWGLLLFASINSAEIFLLLRAKDLGMSDAGVVGLYIFYNLIFALLAYPLGRLSDTIGMKRIFLLGLALFAITYLGMALLSSTAAIIALFFVYGGFAAATDGLAKAWISKVCGPREKAVGLGTFAGLQSLSLLLASVWAGLLWDIAGPMTVFLLTAGLSIPVGLYILLKVKEIDPTEKP